MEYGHTLFKVALRTGYQMSHPGSFLREDRIEDIQMFLEEHKLMIDIFKFCLNIAFNTLEGQNINNAPLRSDWVKPLERRSHTVIG